MITVLVVGCSDRLREQVNHLLRAASIFVARDSSEALRQLVRLDIDLVIWEAAGHSDVEASLTDFRKAAPDCVTVAVTSGEQTISADFSLTEDHTAPELEAVAVQALEKVRLHREIATLRAGPVATPTNIESGHAATPTPARLLREFTRILAAGFDLPRTLELFVDAVLELLRPARLALLLPETDRLAYRVRVHRGLAPQLAESVRLPSDRGLCHWLTVEGRPARTTDISDSEVRRELTLLQGIVAVPLLARGELVAILTVGPPAVRNGYAVHEIETLFDLSTHLASTIHGISLHHRLQRVSEFNQRILEHMSSGVVTIDRDHRVTSLNRRAAQTLALNAKAVVGHDLRILPSPLGDMLYETLATRRGLPRADVRLALRGLSLEISTYPVHGDGDEAAGAVLVFEDVTAQKELAAQKLQAEQFDLLTRVVARIADEIKNPLVSINTFMELIGERFDDPDFREQFSAVVGRDVRRLVQVFEKLTGLVSQGELNFTRVDVQKVVDEAVAAVQRGDDVTRRAIDVRVTSEPTALMVKVDRQQLLRALSYLMWYLGYHSSETGSVYVTVAHQAENDGPDDVLIAIGTRVGTSPRDVDGMFDPVRMVQENLIDIGPAVSQRIVEALGGRLTLRHSRHDLAFVMRLPVAV